MFDAQNMHQSFGSVHPLNKYSLANDSLLVNIPFLISQPLY